MGSILDTELGGAFGFRNSFDLAQFLALLSIPNQDRLDTLVDFIGQRGQRFCPLALELVQGAVFDQDSAEEFQQISDPFPAPPGVVLDDQGFQFDDFFPDPDLDFENNFEGELVFPDVPAEPVDPAGDPITQEDLDFFNSEQFDFGGLDFEEDFGPVEGFGFFGPEAAAEPFFPDFEEEAGF